MSIGIYKITNKINGKSYIGQSVNVERRIKTHFWAAYKENLPSYNFHIYQAIRKYGKDNFEVEILETIKTPDIQKLNELEIKYIKQYDSFCSGYNMTSGGENSEQNLNSGERNSHAKLTKQDVLDIRIAYANLELKRNVYSRYKDKIGESGFKKIWNGITWKNVFPECYTDENKAWHYSYDRALSSEQAALNASKMSKQQILEIKEMIQDGYTNNEIYEILKPPISAREIQCIRNGSKLATIN